MNRIALLPRASRPVWDGPPGSPPRWERPALITLLTTTTLLYVWGLGSSGWANAFYSAAVQAGAHSWKAFFFGSSDSANFITVDKTPLSLWPMELSARLFGVNAWSILVPQTLIGVATVGVLYATVRRSLAALGPGAAAGGALLAGAALATTPVATLMFRFNNPDALLVLLLALGAYGLVRTQERASTGWLLFAFSCVGLGFLTKMLQAFLVLPAFALVHLLTTPTSLRRRLLQLVGASLALLITAGWWVATVAAIPATSRPYIGGSQHNSVLELALGYNGLGRLNGNETGGLGNTDQNAGLTRMFTPELAGQIAWLLPAALLLLATGLWTATHRSGTPTVAPTSGSTGVAGRRGPLFAGFALWGGWLLVTDMVFSLMRGIFHGYYTVALAPAVAALVGMGAAVLWHRRPHPAATGVLAATVALTAWWSWTLLGRTPDFHPWLRTTILIAGLAAAALLLTAGRLPRLLLAAATTTAIAVVLAGPAAYAADTAATPHRGAIPTAGPAAPFGGMRGPGMRGRGGMRGPGAFGGPPPPGAGPFRRPGGPQAPTNPNPAAPSTGTPGGGTRRGVGGPGALLDAATPDAALTALLKRGAASYTWVAATVGSNSAAGYQLATGRPVMALGGFNGTDPAPSLARFQQYVRGGRVHYFLDGSGAFGNPRAGTTGSDDAQRIAAWVRENFTATTVGGTTVYPLSAGRRP